MLRYFWLQVKFNEQTFKYITPIMKQYAINACVLLNASLLLQSMQTLGKRN